MQKKLADAQLANIRSKLQEARASGANAQTIANLEEKQQQLINTSNDAKDALQGIASSSTKLEIIQDKLAKAAQAREQAFAVLEEYVVGGESTRESLQGGASGIMSALRTGTLQNQTEEQRGQTVALLDKLKDVQIGTSGLTGQEVKQELVFRDAVRLGFPPEIAKELATSTSTEEQMLDELKKQTALQERAAAGANDIPAENRVAEFARGGVVYRAGGGSIFKPKGTDTVPAMLTPGEFVIRKSAVDKIGAGNLAALNNGNGVVYRAGGGDIPKGGINAANAVTKDKGQQIAFPDSQQVRDLLNAVASGDPGGFIKLMSSTGYINKSQRGLFQTLVRSGNFEPRRALKALDSKTDLLSSIQSAKEYLKENVSSLTASGIDVMPGKDVDGVLSKIKTYSQDSINKLSGTPGQVLSELSRRGGFDIVGGFQKLLGLAGGGGGNAAAVSGTGTVSTAGGARVAKAVEELVAQSLYLNKGGGISGSDIIPAMLTPGEFVMNPEAVQKYGVGYMKSLNRGTVPGFRRGGLVGTGNVRYRANGSSGPESGGGGLSIDPTGLQTVLTEFSASFQTGIDNIMTTFNNIGSSITNLASAISNGMTVTHQFSGDMKMAFNIENGDHLKNAIAEAITPKISQIVSDEISRRLDDFQAGG